MAAIFNHLGGGLRSPRVLLLCRWFVTSVCISVRT